MPDFGEVTNAYIKGDMKKFYTLIQKMTRKEVGEFSNHMEALTHVLRHAIKVWDDALNYPAKNEE